MHYLLLRTNTLIENKIHKDIDGTVHPKLVLLRKNFPKDINKKIEKEVFDVGLLVTFRPSERK